MKKYFAIFLSSLALFAHTLASAGYTPYCEGTKVSNAEDAVIQRLVLSFGLTMGCEIGDNCLRKFAVTKKTEKFSIAWKHVCGPTIGGIKQLGDNGQGSTFACRFKSQDSVCCAPLGYEHVKKFTLCSDTLTKHKTYSHSK